MKMVKSVFVILISVLMLSTVTAMPIINMVNDDEEELKDEPLKLMDRKTNPLERLVFKMIHISGLNTILGGCELVQECNNAYNDANVRNAIESQHSNIDTIIESYKYSDEISNFFDIEKTFNLDNIKNRIDCLHPTTALNDIQYLLRFSPNYKQFNETRYDYGVNFMDIAMKKNFTDLESYYSLVDAICNAMVKISMVWTIPLTILFGMVGLLISGFITYVFFAPITIPMSLYISLTETINGNSSMQEDLIAIMVATGLVGLCTLGLPILLESIFMTEYGLSGFLYVFERLSLLSLTESKGDYILKTGEVAPEIYGFGSGGNWGHTEGKTIEFDAWVKDDDTLYYNGITDKRDYIRLCFDWDSNGIFDEYGLIEKNRNGYYTYDTSFKAGHYNATIVAFDLMGGFSNKYIWKFDIKKSGHERTYDFPFLNFIKRFFGKVKG